MPRRKYLRPDQILAVLRNVKENVSEYDDIDSGSESDLNDSKCESDASYKPELDSGDNTNIDELEEDISGSVNFELDSSECTHRRPRIEGQVEATVPPQESSTALPLMLNRKAVRMLSWCLALHKPEPPFRSVVAT